ncbi:PLD nuclease N-terminal domain-containing protein [Pengzhenrongella phosphoraccumulans]|uniref:PLD nuclease N-terminal domain-containing protein n=1 Tax=Pengzhenrongella phosphoraccumulans TaxID=3114394 RepID=UPI00388DF180
MPSNLSSLPVGVLVALVVVGLVQITLEVIALLDLYRRPTDRVLLANKWVWVAVIVLANIIGPILYLVTARKPAAIDEISAPAGTSSTRTDTIADALYSPRSDTERA